MGENLMEGINQSLCDRFDIKTKPLNTFSPLTFAFLGDGVFEIVVRTLVVNHGNVAPSKLHAFSAHIVRAESQAKILDLLSDELTEEEQDIVRRGRNAKPKTHAKNASIQDYKKATALEALLGYLYMKGDDQRIVDLIYSGLKKGNFL